MKRFLLFASSFAFALSSFAQKNMTKIIRPKVVVGIVVDQMRWDYLYRFYDLYKADGGFKRLLGDGFSCDNTMVPYLPTVTACGHTCVYTGSVPAIHGITGNNWWDNNLNREMYCTEDKKVTTVGSSSVEPGQMSPVNVQVTTITDELRLATNFKNKVIGISMKDRGAIIPAGHSANGAYWYDGKSGNFITSTYYMQELPDWMKQFNGRKLVDSFYKLNWNLALAKDKYMQYCDDDANPYEAKPFGATALTMPYQLAQFAGNDYSKITVTPFANDLLASLAKSAIISEHMGKTPQTDFLAVSFSSTDYVGHAFGPNSWELMDTYVRLDETLGNLFAFLDKTLGKDQYTVFLTADHAGAHVPEFLAKHGIPGGRWDDNAIKKELTTMLQKKYGVDSLINYVGEYDVYLNRASLVRNHIDMDKVKNAIRNYLLKNDKVLQVVDLADANAATVPLPVREMVINGYNPAHSGDLQIIMKTGVMDSGPTGMSHGVWNAYDAHIPLVWMGWGIKPGHTTREVSMTDIAATVAALLHIQMPSGCVGKVITEIVP